MKKYIMIVMVIVLSLSFAACSRQVEEAEVNPTPYYSITSRSEITSQIFSADFMAN